MRDIGICILCFALLVGPVYSHVPDTALTDAYGVRLDEKLKKILNSRNGFYIEVGAHDGITQANTYFLEKEYNWSGILVEPSPSLFRKLQENRPGSYCYQCALGTFEEDQTYVWGDFDGNLMASVKGNRRRAAPGIRVLMRSLQSILDERAISYVDFFSLDVEGYEMNVLQGIDFNRTQFKYLMIEIYKNNFYEIVSLLAAHGYTLVECMTNYSKATNPDWDGMHNDYLFKKI